MNYNLNKIEIINFNEIDETNIQNYYRYNNVDFYYKKNNISDKLIVSFHGAIRGNNIRQPLPVFRSFNMKKYNLLSISDALLELYENLDLGWFLYSKQSTIGNTYIEIIKFFLTKYSNVIFSGSSGGGFPSLLYSSYFYKKALIYNSQFYLDKYYDKLKKIIDTLEIEISDFEQTNCEEIIKKYNLPFCAIIYCNINDTHHYEYHFMQFRKFIFDNNLDSNFKFIEFVGNEPEHQKSHHHILLPNTTTDNICIDELFEL